MRIHIFFIQGFIEDLLKFLSKIINEIIRNSLMKL